MVITASRELLAMIRAPRSVDLVGADLVEVPPAPSTLR